MKFLDKFAKEYKCPDYFIVIMKRMGLDSPLAFSNMLRSREEILRDFESNVKSIAANKDDPHYKKIKNHLIDVLPSFNDFNSYHAPMGVESYLDCKL